MEDTYASLAGLIQQKAATSQHGRIIVGISGPPGSGKSTVTTRLAALLNSPRSANNNPGEYIGGSYAVAVSVDGFHLTRKELAAMPNAEEVFARRGAPWTFDADGILEFVQSLKATCLQPAALRSAILAPSFDHALKDPVPASLCIPPAASVILLEHNYLLLDQGRWATIATNLDFKVFIQVDEDVAQERVARRHLLSGIEATMEASIARFQTNDALNGRLIRETVVHGVDVEVRSV